MDAKLVCKTQIIVKVVSIYDSRLNVLGQKSIDIYIVLGTSMTRGWEGGAAHLALFDDNSVKVMSVYVWSPNQYKTHITVKVMSAYGARLDIVDQKFIYICGSGHIQHWVVKALAVYAACLNV